MAFIITQDHIDNGLAEGHATPCCVVARCPHRFRLYDDDGELYFEGRSDDNNSERAFEPLDQFGAAYGCTEIRYKTTSGWEVL